MHDATAPLITVITVCYNSVSTLARALQSVKDQDWPHIEHIVVDGASSDGTLNTIARFQNDLALVISEPDKGIYDAMNKGLDHAHGEIVCFLNADDQYASPQVLTHVAQQMQAYQLDALMGDVDFFHEQAPTRTVRRYRSDRFRPNRLAWGWMPAHPALFMRRSVIERVGRFKTDYRIAGDYEFVVRAFHGHTLQYRHIPEVLVRMQMGGSSTKGWRATVLLNREVRRACLDNGLHTNMFKILSKYPLKLLEMLR